MVGLSFDFGPTGLGFDLVDFFGRPLRSTLDCMILIGIMKDYNPLELLWNPLGQRIEPTNSYGIHPYAPNSVGIST